jgi:retron-type reverse transcriptase
VPTVSDRALQRSTAEVLSAIYEQDFLSCSFGGRLGLGAHHALATLTEVIAGSKVGWVLEADLKNFFGSLDHGWMLQFVQHRIGDPRLISLIRRWLKAGVLEDGVVTPSEMGTPQGGSISVLLSNVYLEAYPVDSGNAACSVNHSGDHGIAETNSRWRGGARFPSFKMRFPTRRTVWRSCSSAVGPAVSSAPPAARLEVAC